MTTMPFSGEVERIFARALRNHQFHLVESVVSESFDNAYVIAESSGLRIRFARDRGFVSVELARLLAPDDWYDLEVLKAAITRSDPGNATALDKMGAFLDEHYVMIAQMFRAEAWPNTEAQLRRVGLERLQKTFPQLLPEKKGTS
jgi:hypothetical protein